MRERLINVLVIVVECSYLTMAQDSRLPKVCENGIVGFDLIDTDRNINLGPLPYFLDYTAEKTLNFNIVAVPYQCKDRPKIRSVQVEFAGNVRCERWAPYSVFGDDNPKGPDTPIEEASFQQVTIPIGGPYLIKATPFEGHGCSGVKGQSLEQEMTVFGPDESVDCPGAVVAFNLYNADEDLMMFRLGDAGTICSPDFKINIEALVVSCDGGVISSVELDLNKKGEHKIVRTENVPPFLLFGDKPNRNVWGGRLSLGEYELTATPYSGYDLEGAPGTPYTIQFSIQSCRSRAIRTV